MRALGFSLILSVLLLIACSGSEFAPHPGPFDGEFTSGETAVGSFTLTVTDGLVGGTGTLMHNSIPVNVSISGVITGKSISGQVANTTYGSGDFTGRFIDEEAALGSFEFVGTSDQQVTSGTWLAGVE